MWCDLGFFQKKAAANIRPNMVYIVLLCYISNYMIVTNIAYYIIEVVFNIEYSIENICDITYIFAAES